MGVWPVQKRKGMRCGSRGIYERMVIKLSRLLQKGRGEGGEEEALDAALARFAGADYRDLTILSAPYQLPPPPPGAPRGTPLALLPAPGGPLAASPHALQA
jgi:hypothetical protein